MKGVLNMGGRDMIAEVNELFGGSMQDSEGASSRFGHGDNSVFYQSLTKEFSRKRLFDDGNDRQAEDQQQQQSDGPEF